MGTLAALAGVIAIGVMVFVVATEDGGGGAAHACVLTPASDALYCESSSGTAVVVCDDALHLATPAWYTTASPVRTSMPS